MNIFIKNEDVLQKYFKRDIVDFDEIIELIEELDREIEKLNEDRKDVK